MLRGRPTELDNHYSTIQLNAASAIIPIAKAYRYMHKIPSISSNLPQNTRNIAPNFR